MKDVFHKENTMLEGVSARGLLEIAKTIGQVDIAFGLRMFFTEYFKKGDIIYLDDWHPAEVMEDNIFSAPFLFVTSSDVSGGEPGIYKCDNDEGAINLINTVFAELIKVMETENIQGGENDNVRN